MPVVMTRHHLRDGKTTHCAEVPTVWMPFGDEEKIYSHVRPPEATSQPESFVCDASALDPVTQAIAAASFAELLRLGATRPQGTIIRKNATVMSASRSITLAGQPCSNPR